MSSTTSQRISLFTSESVSAGHPDKLADRISDTILDRFLAAEPSARVACETFLTDSLVVLGGEFHTVDPAVFARIRDEAPELVRTLLHDTGYSGDFPGIDPDRCEIHYSCGPDRDRCFKSFIASGIITHKLSNGHNPQFFVKRCRLLSDSL